MELNLILAGVGGQGILTIAQMLSQAALNRGWNVKQSEVHGMSQRGGAVQAHLRMADHELHSDLIRRGRADLIVAVEPLESLRYVEYLAPTGVLVSSSLPFLNIPNYPAIEEVLARIAQRGRHVLLDSERIAREAGSVRAANLVMLGAASLFVDLPPEELDAVIAARFARRGADAVETNRRAFRFGRRAAAAYLDGLGRGAAPRAVRQWLEKASFDGAGDESAWLGSVPVPTPTDELSGPEEAGVAQILEAAAREGRDRLYEHEVYALVALCGAIQPPRHVFVAAGEVLRAERLEALAGAERVAVKLVSPDVTHKTEAGGVAFVANDADVVTAAAQRMRHEAESRGLRVAGALIVEFVQAASGGFGRELFVGIRTSREFGPVMAAGLGGVDTEYLAAHMKPGVAVAKALAVDMGSEGFFALFQRTGAYAALAGRVRGHERVVADGELIRCFRAFIALARRFCVHARDGGPHLLELEVNPFAFSRQRMIPLDGRGRLGGPVVPAPPRPSQQVAAMLEPRSMAVVGVSARRKNFGRIILNNTQACGFSLERLYVVKNQSEPIDGVRCVPSIAALPERVDLLVAATAATGIPRVVGDVVESDKARSVVIIPGGLGEKEGTRDAQQRLGELIAAARRAPGAGPVFLGGNSMGILSHPGRYDTFFVPRDRRGASAGGPPRRLALVSQSGAFMITRMSNLQRVCPMIAVSLGNQADVTVSDVLFALAGRSDLDTVGVYVEGFNALDGLAFVRAVQAATAAGKIVVFYKAGRTAVGRSAAAGHTASVAGDYDVCQAAAAQAGAVVVDTFKEFEQLLELSVCLHGRQVAGRRIGVISNAGYETVGMADAIAGARYELHMATLDEATLDRLRNVLADGGIADLVNARNPLDLTPMADDATYEAAARALLECPTVDAVVVGCVPMTPRLKTLPREAANPDALAARLCRQFAATVKPMVVVVDSGPPFEALVDRLRDGGLPVFRSADQAIRSLGRYLCHHVGPERPGTAAEPDASAAEQNRAVPAGAT